MKTICYIVGNEKLHRGSNVKIFNSPWGALNIIGVYRGYVFNADGGSFPDDKEILMLPSMEAAMAEARRCGGACEIYQVRVENNEVIDWLLKIKRDETRLFPMAPEWKIEVKETKYTVSRVEFTGKNRECLPLVAEYAKQGYGISPESDYVEVAGKSTVDFHYVMEKKTQF